MSIISWFEEEHPILTDQYREFVVNENIKIVDKVAVTQGDGGPKIGVAVVEQTKSGTLVHHMRLDPGHESEIFGNNLKFGPSLKRKEPKR